MDKEEEKTFLKIYFLIIKNNMAKILLNESTEIEVVENRAEIKALIREKVQAEKLPYKGDDLHFVELNRVVIERKFITKTGWLFDTTKIIKIRKIVKTDLYFKRILFIYD